MPLVGENRDEMYRGCDGSSFHPWMEGISMAGRPPSMDGGIHGWNATYTGPHIMFEGRSPRHWTWTYW